MDSHQRSQFEVKPRIGAATWAGLAIALFGLLIVHAVVAQFYKPFSYLGTIWGESLNWLLVIALIIIIYRGEGLNLRSVGVGTAPPGKSILWGIVILVLCIIFGPVVATLFHFKGGQTGAALLRLPTWLATAVVVRAGVVEELFYRGYAIERLESLGLNSYVAGAIPLLIFSLGHAINNWANVPVALALGAILTTFYLWRRDLVANMIAHFATDFLFVILPRFAPHAHHVR
jgi:membrane protease YdiL (CAAX protease family)